MSASLIDQVKTRIIEDTQREGTDEIGQVKRLLIPQEDMFSLFPMHPNEKISNYGGRLMDAIETGEIKLPFLSPKIFTILEYGFSLDERANIIIEVKYRKNTQERKTQHTSYDRK